MPVTVSLPPELLDRLGASPTTADQDLMQRLAAAVARREVLSRPYVAMDPSTAAGSPLANDYTRLLAQGEDTLRRLLPGPVPDRSAFLAEQPLDDAGAQLVRNLGTLNVVLSPAGGDKDPKSKAAPTQTLRVRSSDGSTLTAAVLDRTLIAQITKKDDPVLAAYHVAAQLVALQSEDQGQPGRGIVVQPPADWAISSVFLGTLEDELARIPQLRPMSLSTLFQITSATREGDAPVTIPPTANTASDPDNLSGQVTERRVHVQQVASMLPANDSLASDMRQLLDLSLAEDNTAAQRATYLSTVDNNLNAVTGSLVSTNRRRFTITSKHSTIPITVRTTWDEPLKVKLRLSSPKLDFPTGDQIITVDKSSPPFRVPVEAKTNGTFKVTAALLTPDGDTLLGPPDAITVRSTALSGLGILVTIGAALVLAVWWLQNYRSRRRQKRGAAAAERHPTAPINRDTLPIRERRRRHRFVVRPAQPLADELGLSIVPLTVRFGTVGYLDRRDLTPSEFWARCAASPVRRSGGTGAGDVRGPLPQPGRDRGRQRPRRDGVGDAVRHGPSAQLAARSVQHLIRVEVVDSRTASAGLGMIAAAAAHEARSGVDLDRLLRHTLDLAARTEVWAMLDSLHGLRRGGRVGATKAAIAEAFSVKPIVQVRAGRVDRRGRIRTRARALDALVAKVRAAGPLTTLGVLHADAGDVDELVEALAPLAPGPILVTDVGPVIGSHCGRRAVGVAFQTEREQPVVCREVDEVLH